MKANYIYRAANRGFRICGPHQPLLGRSNHGGRARWGK